MNTSKNRTFTVIVLILLIIASVLAVVTWRGILKSSPEALASSQPTMLVSDTPEPTEEPVVQTPDTTPEKRVIDESGSISSPEGKLMIRADWHLSSVSDTELLLDIGLYLNCYSIDVGPKNGVIRVCGREYEFTSEEQTSGNDDTKHDSLLYELSVKIPAKAGETVAVPISANWFYNAGYAGVSYDTITAESTLTVTG